MSGTATPNEESAPEPRKLTDGEVRALATGIAFDALASIGALEIAEEMWANGDTTDEIDFDDAVARALKHMNAICTSVGSMV